MEITYHVFLDGLGERHANKLRVLPFLILTEDEAENTLVLDTVNYCIWKGLPKGRYSDCADITNGIIRGLRECTTTKREILYSNYTV